MTNWSTLLILIQHLNDCVSQWNIIFRWTTNTFPISFIRNQFSLHVWLQTLSWTKILWNNSSQIPQFKYQLLNYNWKLTLTIALMYLKWQNYCLDITQAVSFFLRTHGHCPQEISASDRKYETLHNMNINLK